MAAGCRILFWMQNLFYGFEGLSFQGMRFIQQFVLAWLRACPSLDSWKLAFFCTLPWEGLARGWLGSPIGPSGKGYNTGGVAAGQGVDKAGAPKARKRGRPGGRKGRPAQRQSRDGPAQLNGSSFTHSTSIYWAPTAYWALGMTHMYMVGEQREQEPISQDTPWRGQGPWQWKS